MDTTIALPLSPKSSTSETTSSLGTPDKEALARQSSNIDATLLRPSHLSCHIGLDPISQERSHYKTQPLLCKDPFVTPRSQSSNLSPTASSFEPFTGVTKPKLLDHISSISSLLSNEIGLSRTISISSFDAIQKSEIEEVLLKLKHDGHLDDGETAIEIVGTMAIIHFSDIREACAAYVQLRLTQAMWTIQYTDKSSPSPVTWNVKEPGNLALLTVSTAATNKPFDHFQIFLRLQDILQKFGVIFAIKIVNYLPGAYMEMSIEFCDTRAASSAMESSDDLWFDESFSTTRTWLRTVPTPIPDSATPQTCREEVPLTWTPCPTRQTRDMQPVADSHLALFPILLQPTLIPRIPYSIDAMLAGEFQGQLSAQPRIQPGLSSIDNSFRPPPSPTLSTPSSFSPPRFQIGLPRVDTRRQTPVRPHRSPSSHSASHHNYVDVKRIRDGIDVRTTIMLRNIPNKVDQAMLKRLIDESSWGKYDFMYLRIDFANNCNVGYAFINFVDPLDIINFVHARGNQRWNCFKSDKVAEISYATIQGKDCLVQKFRNSSVMLEAAHYRPKLFFTSNGPLPEMAGQEEHFPGPDNQSKMKRSCENAEHVGLFTPNAGQQYRDEQRRRRSQYDRGTRLAALEEYDFTNSVQQLCLDPK